MTREQREMIARTVGCIWAIANAIEESELSKALNETAQSLDKMLMRDVDAANWCDSCTVTYGDGSKVSNT